MRPGLPAHRSSGALLNAAMMTSSRHTRAPPHGPEAQRRARRLRPAGAGVPLGRPVPVAAALPDLRPRAAAAAAARVAPAAKPRGALLLPSAAWRASTCGCGMPFGRALRLHVFLWTLKGVGGRGRGAIVLCATQGFLSSATTARAPGCPSCVVPLCPPPCLRSGDSCLRAHTRLWPGTPL